MYKITSGGDGTRTLVKNEEHYTWHEWTDMTAVSDPLAADMLEIAKSVFLADRLEKHSLKLGQRRRKLQVEVPVYRRSSWDKVRKQIEDVLSFASEDDWKLIFTERALPKKTKVPVASPSSADNKIVALFSGGVDSCCGAAYLASKGAHPIFVTHSPPGRERTPKIIKEIWTRNGNKNYSDIGYYVFKLNPNTDVFRDPIRRTRPFYFLSLAVAVALENKVTRIQMSENGAMALSLPIRAGGYGLLRTRQAHKYIRSSFEKILNTIAPEIGHWEINNPFEYNTKGEACGHLSTCEKMINQMPSCEYFGQQSGVIQSWIRDNPIIAKQFKMGNGPHCGICEPCICRRAALKKAGIKDPEKNYYFNARHVSSGKLSIQFDRVKAKSEDNPRPPLFDKAATHVLWFERFSKKILSMDKFTFGVEYLTELRKFPYEQNLSSAELQQHYDLISRMSGEVLDFLNG